MGWPSRNFERVPLPSAAAMVLLRVTDAQIENLRAAEIARNLDAVARALSTLAQIYAGEPAETATELAAADLLGGAFDGGARVFRTRDGREFYPLSIERRDMLAAIRVLRAARVRFK